MRTKQVTHPLLHHLPPQRRLMHLDCQVELLRRTPSHAYGCPVCLTQYVNVTTVNQRGKLTFNGMRLVVYVFGIVSIIIIATFELIMYVLHDHLAFLVVGASFMTFGLVFGVLGFFVFRRVRLFASVRTLMVSPPNDARRGIRMTATRADTPPAEPPPGWPSSPEPPSPSRSRVRAISPMSPRAVSPMSPRDVELAAPS